MSTVKGPYVPSKVVFEQLERDRISGELREYIAKFNPTRYQISLSHSGFLEMIDSQDNISIGTFSSGKFRPLKKGY